MTFSEKLSHTQFLHLITNHMKTMQCSSKGESFLYKKRPNHLVSEKVEFQHVLCAHSRMDWLQDR